MTEPVAQPFVAKRPMIDMKIWLLPEPDSPTTPSVSPARTSKLTPFTALTSPSRVENRVSRLLTSNTFTGGAPAAASFIS